MSSAAVAIPLALATTTVFNAGLVVEKQALTRMPALSPRHPGRAIATLLSSPRWLAGLTMMLAGLACQVTVLSLEPISLVQPVLAAGIAVTLLLSRLVLRERMGRAESACVAVLAASLVVLALSQDAARGVSTWRPGIVPAAALIGPSLAVAVLAEVWPWRAKSASRRAGAGTGGGATALLVGIGTGLLYGVSALATKGLSDVVGHDRTVLSLGAGLLSSPYLYLLAVCSAVPMLFYQAALQASRASVLIPVTNVISNAYFVVAGTWLFHEPLPASPVKLALRLTGIASAGIVLVIMSARAGRSARRSPDERAAGAPRVTRQLAGLVLAGLAAFFAVSAALPGWPIAGHSPQASADGHQVQTLTASGATYLDPVTLTDVAGAHIQVTRAITATASTYNSSLASWTVYTTTFDTDRQLQLEPKSRTLVFNRRTAQLVTCCYASINGNGLIRQSGVAGYAFPAGARKQTYQVFDDVLDSPEPFRYAGQGTIDGIPVYRYAESVAAAPAGYLLVPFRDPVRYTAFRVYSVDPETGAVLATTEHEDLYLDQPLAGASVTRLFDATLSTTPATVAMLARQDQSVRREVVLAARIRLAFAATAGLFAVLAGFLLAGKRNAARVRLSSQPAHHDAFAAADGAHIGESARPQVLNNLCIALT
jgi:hypothetical protein